MISCHIAKKLQHNRVEATAMYVCLKKKWKVVFFSTYYFCLTHLLKHKTTMSLVYLKFQCILQIKKCGNELNWCRKKGTQMIISTVFFLFLAIAKSEALVVFQSGLPWPCKLQHYCSNPNVRCSSQETLCIFHDPTLLNW